MPFFNALNHTINQATPSRAKTDEDEMVNNKYRRAKVLKAPAPRAMPPAMKAPPARNEKKPKR